MRTAAILPVAGLSSRMGDFKPLMGLNGLPLVCMTAQSALDGGASPVCVVLGRKAAEVEHALRTGVAADGEGGAPLVVVRNPDFASTDMFCSIRLGLRRLLEDGRGDGVPDAVYVLPGDMPGVSPRTFGALRRQAEQGDAPLLCPRFHGRRGHPLLVRRACFDSILGFGGGGGMRGALGDLDQRTVEVEVDDEGVLLDADEPAAFSRLAAFVHRTKGIAPGQVEEILETSGTPPHIRDHCRAVSRLAAQMAQRLDAQGLCLDTGLCRSAAALHDMLRLQKDHARAAADSLCALGYEALAAVVGSHQGFPPLPPSDDAAFTEASVVCLADKLVQETRIVTLDERYRAALERFDVTTDTGQRIRRDKGICEALLARYEELTGDRIFAGAPEKGTG
ncbi:MAG: NTP transferase domain-containing protein [Coriobacteriales bacterium]|jgi:CTP:molybdopterin cytidylyltransferase MocA|nr:NTP transferase domain-containing protein [Coriobacteriales bacterium]